MQFCRRGCERATRSPTSRPGQHALEPARSPAGLRAMRESCQSSGKSNIGGGGYSPFRLDTRALSSSFESSPPPPPKLLVCASGETFCIKSPGNRLEHSPRHCSAFSTVHAVKHNVGESGQPSAARGTAGTFSERRDGAAPRVRYPARLQPLQPDSSRRLLETHKETVRCAT